MIQLNPIGTIHNQFKEAQRDIRWEKIESNVEIREEWREMLSGLEEFSHIWVIFYIDRISPPDSSRVRPMGREDMPLVGRFATRSPSRPNPIGITAVELVEMRGTTLRVRGLDALDGTPVLDVKPYLSRGDAIENTRVAEWVRRYWAIDLPEES